MKKFLQILPLFLGMFGMWLFIYLKGGFEYENNIDDPTPTLTGEYGSPDGWETLTGLYVE